MANKRASYGSSSSSRIIRTAICTHLKVHLWHFSADGAKKKTFKPANQSLGLIYQIKSAAV
jgi:hypothetical protein